MVQNHELSSDSSLDISWLSYDAALTNFPPDAMEPQDRPSISLTPPGDSLNHHHIQEQHSLYQLGTNPTGASLDQIPEAKGQSRWYMNHMERIGRFGSDLGEAKGQRPPSPIVSSRRHGMVIPDSFSSGHYPSATLSDITESPDKVSRDRSHNCLKDADTLAKLSQADHHQNINDSPASLLNSSSASSKDLDAPPPSFSGYSDMEKQGFPLSEDITPSKDIPSVGSWRCCECRKEHSVYRFEVGQHLISILNCLCKHRSCRNCTFEGNVRRFAPIDDTFGVASVPEPEVEGKGVRFGVVCQTCGLSWRARKVEQPKRHVSLRQRLSILPMKVNPLHKLRNTRSMIHLSSSRDLHLEVPRPGTALYTSRSIFNLRSASDTQAKSLKLEKQVQGAEVRFYGIECTCGSMTSPSSICFQVVDSPDTNEAPQKNGISVEATGIELSPELRSRGYGTSTLHLKGGSHPNPLRSNPVQVPDL